MGLVKTPTLSQSFLIMETPYLVYPPIEMVTFSSGQKKQIWTLFRYILRQVVATNLTTYKRCRDKKKTSRKCDNSCHLLILLVITGLYHKKSSYPTAFTTDMTCCLRMLQVDLTSGTGSWEARGSRSINQNVSSHVIIKYPLSQRFQLTLWFLYPLNCL